MADQSSMRRLRLALLQERFQPSGRAGKEEGLDSVSHSTFLPQRTRGSLWFPVKPGSVLSPECDDEIIEAVQQEPWHEFSYRMGLVDFGFWHDRSAGYFLAHSHSAKGSFSHAHIVYSPVSVRVLAVGLMV